MIRYAICGDDRVRRAAAEQRSAFAVAWDDLTDAQRQVLSSYHSQWSGLSSEQQQRLASGAQRWSTMDPQDRARRCRSGSRAGSRCRPSGAPNCRSVSSSSRACRRSSSRNCGCVCRTFVKLPPEQQRHLRERFRAMSPQQRAQALDRMKARGPSGSIDRNQEHARRSHERSRRSDSATAIGVVHARRQCARDGKSPRTRLRHDHLRSGRRGCAGCEGDRARSRLLRPCAAAAMAIANWCCA